MQELWRAPVRERLVRLCAAISAIRPRRRSLAQETLLEAWRNAHKLRDPSGAERWLAAIARRLFAERPASQPEPLSLHEGAAWDEVDLDAELERAELLELLDRALALLPPETREALVQRYVDDAPHSEIAARLGVSEDAVSMRLARGKSVLRRMLAAELRREADADWRETRVWCGQCGRRKLAMRDRRAHAAVTFSCPDCSPGVPGSDFPLGNPHFAELVGGLVRPSAILARTGDWLQRYFGGRRRARRLHALRLRRHGGAVSARGEQEPRWAVRRLRRMRRAGCLSSVEGLALARAEVRRFRREHPRTRLLPAARPRLRRRVAFLRGCAPEDVLGRSAVDVVFAGEQVTRARRRPLSALETGRRFLLRRDLALLWTGGLVSIAGDWAPNAALPFFVYERTGSTIATAGTGLVSRRSRPASSPTGNPSQASSSTAGIASTSSSCRTCCRRQRPRRCCS